VTWLIAWLVAVGVLVARGPAGRSPGRVVAGRRPPGGDALAPARGPRAGRRWWRARGADGADLATVAVDVAGRLRAGADPAAAWQSVLGVRLAPGAVPTMQDLAAATPDRAQAAVVVAAARLAAELGAPLAPLLDGVAHELAAEADVEGERRAALAGPRATARVLTGLPVLGVVLGAAVGADPVAVLLDGGIGSGALAGGVLLLWVGQVWTRRLAASAVAAGRAA
jgi:tight adherence protein B